MWLLSALGLQSNLGIKAFISVFDPSLQVRPFSACLQFLKEKALIICHWKTSNFILISLSTPQLFFFFFSHKETQPFLDTMCLASVTGKNITEAAYGRLPDDSPVLAFPCPLTCFSCLIPNPLQPVAVKSLTQTLS